MGTGIGAGWLAVACAPADGSTSGTRPWYQPVGVRCLTLPGTFFPRRGEPGPVLVGPANSHGRAISGQRRLKRKVKAYIVLHIAGSGDIRASGFAPVELVFQRNH